MSDTGRERVGGDVAEVVMEVEVVFDVEVEVEFEVRDGREGRSSWTLLTSYISQDVELKVKM